MPVICGSTTHTTAPAPTAASAALPPARSASTAASVASGCEVAAMPSQAITGERPGSWKSRLIINLRLLERSGRDALDAFDREIALSRTQRHREAADHIDETNDQQQEEGRAGGP